MLWGESYCSGCGHFCSAYCCLLESRDTWRWRTSHLLSPLADDFGAQLRFGSLVAALCSSSRLQRWPWFRAEVTRRLLKRWPMKEDHYVTITTAVAHNALQRRCNCKSYMRSVVSRFSDQGCCSWVGKTPSTLQQKSWPEKLHLPLHHKSPDLKRFISSLPQPHTIFFGSHMVSTGNVHYTPPVYNCYA